MTLEKATEILRDLLGEAPQWPPDDRRDAVKLGIEALELIKESREDRYYLSDQPLPSEAER